MSGPEEPRPTGKGRRKGVPADPSVGTGDTGAAVSGSVPSDQVDAAKAGPDVGLAGVSTADSVPGAAATGADVDEVSIGDAAEAAGAADPATGTADEPAAESGGTTEPPDTAAGGYTSVDSPAAVHTGTPAGSDAAEPAPGSAGPTSTAAADAALMSPTPPTLKAPTTGTVRRGMFGSNDGGDTSGFGGLVIEPYSPAPAERPYGGYFDEVADALLAAMAERSIPPTALLQTTVDRNEITFYVDPIHLTALLWAVRDEPALRFEMLASLSGVDYGVGVPRRLHVSYDLLSMTYRRRIRLEVALDVEDPHVPSAVAVYPTADWHERETWDMFGIVFAGHPALTRILMPDDWVGHPQRKDYPLGGIPVEYKGVEIAPPDERRSYS